jgi:hypothetical protein
MDDRAFPFVAIALLLLLALVSWLIWQAPDMTMQTESNPHLGSRQG